ncbi:MAG: hypothetical protein KC416_10890 [Myxococcales bacterium]|nr:hypothetical protein [Myxococcales bacterium]
MRKPLARAFLATAFAGFGVLTVAAPLHADDRADGLYGRFDGDLVWSVGAGAGIALGATERREALMADLRFRYLDTAGLFLAPRWLPDDPVQVALGVELRPLFPARFLLDLSSRNRWIDLLVDSFGVELGTLLVPGRGNLGAALHVGIGAEIPLWWPGQDFEGAYLRLTASRTEGGGRLGPPLPIPPWTLGAVLIVRLGASVGLADRPRTR